MDDNGGDARERMRVSIMESLPKAFPDGFVFAAYGEERNEIKSSTDGDPVVLLGLVELLKKIAASSIVVAPRSNLAVPTGLRILKGPDRGA